MEVYPWGMTPDNPPCALITGASAGLGEEFALQLAPISRHLILVARRGDALEALAERIRRDHPQTEVTVIARDLSTPEERDHLASTLENEGLSPDLLVNNAGLGDYGEFASSDWEKIRTMLQVNIEALTHLTRLLLPAMIRRKSGAVIHVSSMASLLPIPDFAVYAATKAYVTSFSEALRIELREHGIPVLAVCPGPVHTEFGSVARRAGQTRDMPGHGLFYIAKERVVADALDALRKNRARIYPGKRTTLAAMLISALPVGLLRIAMGFRPRKS